MNKKKIISVTVGIVVIAGIAYWMLGSSGKKEKIKIETATVAKAEISNSVTATGTIEPVSEITVGTQVSGIIDKIYVDIIPWCTKANLLQRWIK